MAHGRASYFRTESMGWMWEVWQIRQRHAARVGGPVVLKPGQRFSNEDNGAWHAGGEGPQGLIDDGTPTHLAVEGRANQMNAASGDANGLTGGIDAKDVVRVAGGTSLRDKIS